MRECHVAPVWGPGGIQGEIRSSKENILMIFPMPVYSDSQNEKSKLKCWISIVHTIEIF